MRALFFIGLLFAAFTVSGQSHYTGFIDKYPVELVLDQGTENGVYLYKSKNTPIFLSAKLEGRSLLLFEKNKSGKNTAMLKFAAFDSNSLAVHGTWTDLVTKKELSINLDKIDQAGQDENYELIQAASSKDKYFRVVLSNDRRVTAIKIIDKKTDHLMQELKVDCQSLGVGGIAVNDFNFDGYPDFSIFEEGFAGPNTASLYFLYDPESKAYFESSFSGISLQFDQKTKRITEYNQCCAGSQLTTVVYKVVKDQMVLISSHCFIWSEKKKRLLERDIKDCQ